jgi:hypothetical protein
MYTYMHVPVFVHRISIVPSEQSAKYPTKDDVAHDGRVTMHHLEFINLSPNHINIARQQARNKISMINSKLKHCKEKLTNSSKTSKNSGYG